MYLHQNRNMNVSPAIRWRPPRRADLHLVEEDDEYDIVAEAGDPVQEWLLDRERGQVVDDGSQELVSHRLLWNVSR